MNATRPSTPVDEHVLRRAREILDQQLAAAAEDAPERAQLLEALLWIDRGVYGRCSVCGECLSRNHVLRAPADKVCAACRHIARTARARAHRANHHSRINPS